MANVGAFVKSFYIISRSIQQARGVRYSRLTLIIGKTCPIPNVGEHTNRSVHKRTRD